VRRDSNIRKFDAWKVGGPRRSLAGICTSLFCGMFLLTGCASSASYMGIDLAQPQPVSKASQNAPSLTAQLERAGCIAPASQRTGETPVAATEECLELIAGFVQRGRVPMGMEFGANYKNIPTRQLASSAQDGDKHAQLELGKRFEWACNSPLSVDHDVPCDMKKAKKLYAAAASDSGGTIWVYSPPVGNGTSGRVIPVNSGPKQVGLAEAKKRLGVKK